MSALLTLPMAPAAAPDRVVVLPNVLSYLLRGVLVTPSPLFWPYHDPGATEDFWIDTSQAIPASDWISAVTPAVALSSGLILTSGTVFGSLVGMWLSGGTPGVTTVGFTITTAAGRILKPSILLPILPLSAADSLAGGAAFTVAA